MERRISARRWLQALGRAASWHRRKLAAVAAAVAVLAGFTALAPAAPETVPVVRAKRSLLGGTVVASADVRTDRLPPSALPAGALSGLTEVVGHAVSGRVAEDQVLSTSDLVGARPSVSAGHVVAPLRLEDAQVAALLPEGALIDVLAAADNQEPAAVVAARVRVVAVPPSAADDARSGQDGALVLVEVDKVTARALARAAVTARLSVVWQ